jgi:CRISPR-associated DxTHG motif protein
MTTRAISFLGYTRPELPYRPTTYVYGDRECHSAFMAEATARFFQHEIDELLVLVTEQAFGQNYADLQRAIAGAVPVRPVHIPSGQNEAELWAMFAAIERQIGQGDQIIFDITNGFRSLPVLALLAATFVRVARGAYVQRMIYGAFDATTDGKTPVFDLTPFVRLLDWTSATDAFLKYGRADDLAALAGDTTLASQLKAMTEALQTSRPAETMEVADGLEDAITATRATTAPAQQPFALLLDRIGAEYASFGLRRPRDRSNAGAVLQKQRTMIAWYIEKGMFVQAMTSAREWIVSLVVLHTGGDLFAKGQRGDAERLLNNNPKTPSSLDPALVPQLDQLRRLWLDARDVRNSLAHVGMLHDAPRAKKVIERVRQVTARLGDYLEPGYASS